MRRSYLVSMALETRFPTTDWLAMILSATILGGDIIASNRLILLTG